MFKLSKKSEKNLEGTHPDGIKVVRYAITISKVDFGVGDGVRTIEEQKENVDKGVSWTMDSYHLIQPLTGFGHAWDLIAYVNGVVSWHMLQYALIAEAMLEGSKKFDVPLVWGTVWDRELSELDLHDGLNNDIDAYVARFRAKEIAKGRLNKKPMLDGPHFQLSERVYKRR